MNVRALSVMYLNVLIFLVLFFHNVLIPTAATTIHNFEGDNDDNGGD